MAGENYDQEYPRPWPCGSLVLGFDRRRAEVLGHRVRIDSGTCEVSFLIDGAMATLEIFVEMTSDRALDADDRRRWRPDRGAIRSGSAHPGGRVSGGVNRNRRYPGLPAGAARARRCSRQGQGPRRWVSHRWIRRAGIRARPDHSSQSSD